MSNKLKWIVALLVIVVAGAGLWESGLISLPTFGAAPAPAAQTAEQTPAQTTAAQSGLPTAQSDSSDAALAQDSAAIDAQMQGMSADSATVDQSLNDQQTAQSF